MLRYQREPIAYVERCAERYGPVFALRLPFVGSLVAAVDPVDVATILTGAPERFPQGPAGSPIAPVMGERAMMFATGRQHRRQRQTLWPAFHGELVERWGGMMAAVAEAELARVPLHEPFAALPVARRIAVTAICRMVFGSIDPHSFARICDQVGRRDDPRLVLMLRFPTLWRRGGRLNPGAPLKRRRDELNRLLLHEIALRRRAAADGVDARDDALSLLVTARDEQGVPLSDAEVRDQLVGLLVVGHETTAAALAWALERLSRCSEARERLTQELAGDARGDAYLDAFVNETLRLRPPLLDAVRTTTTPLDLGAYRVPAGTVVSAMCAIAQRRGNVWEDPLAFRPERFLDGRPTPGVFAPFGGGPRRCIAASVSTLLLRTVLRVAVARATVTDAPGPEEPARLYGLSLLPARGARVTLRPRTGARHSTRSSSISGGRVASQLG